jgi:hypothetical protein
VCGIRVCDGTVRQDGKIPVVLAVINPLEQKKCDQFVIFIHWLHSVVPLTSVHVCSTALVMCVCVYTHTYIFFYICTPIYIYIYIYIYIFTFTHIYIFTYTHTHNI